MITIFYAAIVNTNIVYSHHCVKVGFFPLIHQKEHLIGAYF